MLTCCVCHEPHYAKKKKRNEKRKLENTHWHDRCLSQSISVIIRHIQGYKSHPVLHIVTHIFQQTKGKIVNADWMLKQS